MVAERRPVKFCPRARCRALIEWDAVCCADCYQLVPASIRKDLEAGDAIPAARHDHARAAAMVALRATAARVG